MSSFAASRLNYKMDCSVLSFDDSFPYITFDDSLQTECQHAAHCCIYSPHKFFYETYESPAYVSMQFRFDGRLGFPGGIIDEEDCLDIVAGLNRELREEINLDERFYVKQKDYCFSHTNNEKSWCMHFYKKEVSVQEFEEIERNATDAEEHGKEVLGLFRVPLYTMKDGIRGFPAFLSNNFAGNAKYQLLHFLIENNLMSYDDAKQCLAKSHLQY